MSNLLQRSITLIRVHCHHSNSLLFMGSRFSSSSNPEAMSAAKEYVEKKLASKTVVVFSKTWCPYCTKAKKALAKYGIPADKYEVIELEDRDDCDAIQDYMGQLTGGRSVPRVFIGGKFVGGGDETVAMDASGALKKKLIEAKAIEG